MPRNRPTTLIIAASTPLLLRGLADLTKGVPGLRVDATAQDPATAVALVQDFRPEILIADTELAVSLRDLMASNTHQPRVILIGSTQHLGDGSTGCQEWTCGFTRHQISSGELLAMLQVVARCDIPNASPTRCRGCLVRNTLMLPQLPLSPREYDVFLRIGLVQRPSEIAAHLDISVKTVETYRENIKRKLDLDSAHELLMAALDWRVGNYAAFPP